MDDVWAVLSDVHGNYAALVAALDHAAGEGATRAAFLGDVLSNRTADDTACCRLLRARTDAAVFGNWDVRARLALPDDVAEWLRQLPLRACVGPAFACHSSPASVLPSDVTAASAQQYRRLYTHWDLFPYISGRKAAVLAAEALQARGGSLLFHGHTHRQLIWTIDGAAVQSVRQQEYELADGITLIGVGSVGQGEDGRIEYALYYQHDAAVRLVSLDARPS